MIEIRYVTDIDRGGFTVDIPGYEQPMELIMMKDLRS